MYPLFRTILRSYLNLISTSVKLAHPTPADFYLLPRVKINIFSRCIFPLWYLLCLSRVVGGFYLVCPLEIWDKTNYRVIRDKVGGARPVEHSKFNFRQIHEKSIAFHFHRILISLLLLNCLHYFSVSVLKEIFSFKLTNSTLG